VAVIPISTAIKCSSPVQRQVRNCDILVMCAAVADYSRPKFQRANQKTRREHFSSSCPTRDILSSLPKDRQYLVVRVCAETENVEPMRKKKLREKNCDIVVANDVSRADSGMESDQNEVEICFATGETKAISRASKKLSHRLYRQ